MQVLDNPRTLELMLEDTKNAPEIYRPTNYWAVYEKKFLSELHTLGLRDFRRRRSTILSKFGATDYATGIGVDFLRFRALNNRYMNRIKCWQSLLRLGNSLQVGTADMRIRSKFNTFVKELAKKAGAKPIDEFEASLVGSPEHIIWINSKAYTYKILQYYLAYVYCCSYINFDSIELLAEIGCGSGKQVEVIKKLHPNICFLLFDIPPQLYVSHQYLSAVFPDSVVPYETTREMESLPADRRGKIFIFGCYKFPIIKDLQIDLFWNACSFQEMEPEVVVNYLKYVNPGAKAAYLAQRMSGKQVASKIGERGVLKPSVLGDYKRGLSNFELLDCSSPHMPTADEEANSFWKRV